MSEPLKTWSATLTTLFCLLAFLAGCGGGGSGSAKSGVVVDPASSFKGVTTAATPTNANAENLAMGGFGGGSIAASIRSVAKTGANGADTTKNLPVLQLVQMLKQSARRMEIPQKAALLRKSSQAATLAKSVGRASNYQLQGDGGGTATYALDVNDSTGSFFGTVVYQAFNSKGIIINGTTEVLGTMDANRQQLSRLTLSFRSLSFQSGNFTFFLTGSLSWGFNLASSTETLSMNMVLLDQSSAKTYWFNNYELVTVYSANSLTQTISGRYYDHDHGYVDLTTLTPLVATYGTHWPSQGSLAFTGNLGRSVRLNFQASTLVIEADTDGNGNADWQVERASNVTPAGNTAPTADAGPDQNVTQLATVHLNGSASSDKEGNPLTYTWTFVSGPSYAALSGANTATPSFVASNTGTYVLSLTVYDGNSTSQPDTVTVVVTPATGSDPGFVAQQWQYGIYGSSIGQAGLLTTDLDGDGTPEIIASASVGGFGNSAVWYVVRKTANGGYEQVWRSPMYGITIVRILLADMNGDGKDDVVVGLEDGTIRIYDGPTLKEISSLKTVASLKDLAVADLDGDGTKEIVTSNGTGISVYNAQTGEVKWSVNSGGGASIAVGNVDSDAAPEIVTTTYGGKGYVLNGLTGAVKWSYINSFGSIVRLADLDGDGKQEIIGASSWGKITISDAALQSPVWEIPTS
ncbi:MAG TPA: FG-GAP-like repeat-containing protein, partial [Dongiaceae bacterium]|nr:FG-GAP-like repeat-containing protein [Dongiaceae bacterium]